MILNASIDSGSVSIGLRTAGSPVLVSIASKASRSDGAGRKSTTASSSGCTPLFLKAEPHIIG